MSVTEYNIFLRKSKPFEESHYQEFTIKKRMKNMSTTQQELYLNETHLLNQDDCNPTKANCHGYIRKMISFYETVNIFIKNNFFIYLEILLT